MGAYLRTNGIVPPMLCAMSLHGPYRWQAFRARAIGVLTNKTPLGTFRGPGEVEATFARERMLDLVAGRLSLDPVELRRRNLIPAAELPYLVRFGESEDVLRFGTGDYHAQLDTVLERAGYGSVPLRSKDPGELIGVGVACSVSESGVGVFEWARVAAEPGRDFQRGLRHRERRPGPAYGARTGARRRVLCSPRARRDPAPRHRRGGDGRGRLRGSRDDLRRRRDPPRRRRPQAQRTNCWQPSGSALRPTPSRSLAIAPSPAMRA